MPSSEPITMRSSAFAAPAPPAAVSAARAPLDFACIQAGGQRYALRVPYIREIARWQEPTPLPRAPRWIEGLMDLRANVLPVVDLSLMLGGAPQPRSPRARIVVLAAERWLVGLRVEAALDVVAAGADALETPALPEGPGSSLIEAVLHRPGQPPLLVLDVPRLLAQLEAPAPPDMRGEA
jgi:purine-binding chemotaxis protein CheW